MRLKKQPNYSSQIRLGKDDKNDLGWLGQAHYDSTNNSISKRHVAFTWILSRTSGGQKIAEVKGCGASESVILYITLTTKELNQQHQERKRNQFHVLFLSQASNEPDDEVTLEFNNIEPNWWICVIS